MNEKRKATHDYYSPTVSKNQETIDSLYYAINTFFKNYCGKLSGADWIYLDNILKQLRNKKIKIKSKQLNAWKTRFEDIKQRY